VKPPHPDLLHENGTDASLPGRKEVKEISFVYPYTLVEIITYWWGWGTGWPWRG
jgi:hypothetical protein